MALLIGAIVALLLFLGFHLLGAGFRNPRWLLVGALLIFALYKFGSNQIQRDSQNVVVSAEYATSCPAKHVSVTIQNEGDRAIQRMGFQLTGYQRNNSNSVATRYHHTDRIVPARGSWTHCWRVHALDDVSAHLHPGLRWETEVRSITLAD